MPETLKGSEVNLPPTVSNKCQLEKKSPSAGIRNDAVTAASSRGKKYVVLAKLKTLEFYARNSFRMPVYKPTIVPATVKVQKCKLTLDCKQDCDSQNRGKLTAP